MQFLILSTCGIPWGAKEKYRAGLASLWILKAEQMPRRRKGTAGELMWDTKGASQKVAPILLSIMVDQGCQRKNNKHSAIKRKETLSRATTRMNLEAITLSRISQSKKKTKTMWCHFHEVCRVVRFMRQSRRVVAKGWGKGKCRVAV